MFDLQPVNRACHNLCTTRTPPTGYSSILGLGLNFCPTPSRTPGTDNIQAMCNRFNRDFRTKVMFCDATDGDWNPNQLYCRSQNWDPDADSIPLEPKARLSQFIKTIRNRFCPNKLSHSNLSAFQLTTLQTLRQNPNFVVFPSDKNLGPCIIERDIYIQRCLQDHLLDKTSYKRLVGQEINDALEKTRQAALNFLYLYAERKAFTKSDELYLSRMLENVDPTKSYAHFYIIAKVHKKPWKTRPIVSQPGSQLFAIGKWVDRQLQPFVQELPSFILSSATYKEELSNLPGPLPPGLQLFTADAVAMYTNIDTEDAISTIRDYLFTKLAHKEVFPIISALHLVMTETVIRFGDTFWKQIQGTAMGAPCAPAYANLYFGIKEQAILEEFKEHLLFYKRFIDDLNGGWIPHPDPIRNQELWASFQQRLNSLCSLDWEISELSNSVNFLDLTVSIADGQLDFSLYSKPLNLYHYLPPLSAHQPGLQRGIVYGLLERICRLNSNQRRIPEQIGCVYKRLLARRYNAKWLRKTILDALPRIIRKISNPSPTSPSPEQLQDELRKRVFLHVPYHPRGPTRQALQADFYKLFLNPVDGPPLPLLANKNGNPCGIERLVVAFHRPPNLKNLLSPRGMEFHKDGPAVSTLIPPEPAVVQRPRRPFIRRRLHLISRPAMLARARERAAATLNADSAETRVTTDPPRTNQLPP